MYVPCRSCYKLTYYYHSNTSIVDGIAGINSWSFYITECEDTGCHLSTNGGGSWGKSYSTRPLPLEIRISYSIRQSDRAGERDSGSSHDRRGRKGGDGDGA